MSNKRPRCTRITRHMTRLALLLLGLSLVPGMLAAPTLAQDPPTTGTISGKVVDAAGPVTGAHVRVRATEFFTTSAADGTFALAGIPTSEEIDLTAWAPGYYIAYAAVIPPASDVTLTLRRYHTDDHPDYEWGLPIGPAGDEESGACGQCHPMIVPQWSANAHGTAVSNPRFYSLYNGTDLAGTTPVEPGYLLDFPGTDGSCASCHAPGAAVDGYLTVNMNDARDDVSAGIHCDYCHKVGGVYLDPATNLPYPNVPGVESQRVLRPPADDNIFIGPYDDIHDPDTYLPQISESAFCAPCHQFSMWGTPIYQSYAEWLASPYAEDDITCQNCHMPPTGDSLFATVDAGGLEHPPEAIPSHLQLGAASVDLLQDTVEMAVEAVDLSASGDQITVAVTITNTGAGHHVPTDYPGRHMILTVSASADGQPLTLVAGPTVPAWGGPQADQPGKAYAKVLRDVVTGEAPVVSYWKQTQIASDNRLAALESDTSRYTFAVPADAGPIDIQAALVFRRVFDPVATARQWDMPDIIMAETDLVIPVAAR